MEGGAVGHNFEREPPRQPLALRFGLIWLSGSFKNPEIDAKKLIIKCVFGHQNKAFFGLISAGHLEKFHRKGTTQNHMLNYWSICH